MPVVGWLNAGRFGATTPYLAAFRRGLGETGYVEGQNVAVEYRWADDQYDRVPALAADLVNRNVDVMATIGSVTTVNAARQAAGAIIPIVFGTGGDPVALGLVTSVARPGANLTGVSYLVADLGPKRLDLLVQAVPRAKRIALLVNPKNPNSERNVRETQEAARHLGVQLLVVKAATEGEIDEAFATMVNEGAGAVVIQADPFIHSRRAQLLALAARLAVPAIYTWREFAAEGGLMSYGPNLGDVYRQIGNYVGRILKGTRPADLPVVQPTTFELVVNIKTAKALGLVMPPSILVGAEEVIE
jgi:putative ABC transport system substrate-binding protein